MTASDNHGESAIVAARVERRWAAVAVVVIVVLAGMAAFAGIHQATMPQARVETANPTTLHIAGEFIESNYISWDKQGNMYTADTSVGRVTEMVAPKNK